jgi:hypothetical protein
MATTTPNYGWTVPTSTDLVKDGATAIETLGDAIDASMNTALGTKKAGMVLLNTTSFSGVTTQAFTSIFTSTYENYMIDVSLTSITNQDMAIKLRSSTTDSSTNYDYGMYGFGASGTTRSASGSNATKALLCRGNTATATNRIGWQTVIQKPNLAQPTTLLTVASGTDGTGWFGWSGAACHFAANAYDGFNLIFDGATTGAISIYGYNK